MQVARCFRFALFALGIGSVFPALAGEAQSKTFGWIEEAIIEPEAITVKAKLDTGAKTSSMDAKDLETFKKDGEDWVRFMVELKDANTGEVSNSPVERRVVRRIKVRGAGGQESRPVVMMKICIGNEIYDEQFSLKNRGKMNYPVLIGRRTLEHLGAVDVSQTFTTKPKCKL